MHLYIYLHTCTRARIAAYSGKYILCTFACVHGETAAGKGLHPAFRPNIRREKGEIEVVQKLRLTSAEEPDDGESHES